LRRKEPELVPDEHASAAPFPVTRDVDIPIEVTVDRGGQEIKLNISIQVKIHLE